MRKVVLALFMVLLATCIAGAQQSPPADGVGLGNDHLSGNGSVSNVPSMSPDQNTVMTESNGSTSGDKGIPAFAGSSGAATASEMNGQGTMGVRQSTAATAARRAPYGASSPTQNRAIVVQNGNQVSQINSSAAQNAHAQSSQGSANPPKTPAQPQ